MIEALMTYEFMQKALLMAVLSGSTCALIGVFVVLLRMSFIGICISHASFAGALVGLMAGIPPLAGGFIGGVGVAAAIGPFTEKLKASADSVVGVVFAVMLSLSMLVLGLLPENLTEGLNFMWGNLLTAQTIDLWMMGICTIVVLAYIVFFFKEIEAMVSQKEAARASGVPVQALFYATLILMGIVIAVSLKAVGGILIYALIVTPAVTALQQTYSLKGMFIWSAFWGVIASIIGLACSYWFSAPTGASIVIAATLCLIVVRVFVNKEQ